MRKKKAAKKYVPRKVEEGTADERAEIGGQKQTEISSEEEKKR